MRSIVQTKEFDDQVTALGGARAIDEALSPFMEALAHNPFGFHKFESDRFKFRWFTTRETYWGTPPLYVVFTIEEKEPFNVVLIEIGALDSL